MGFKDTFISLGFKGKACKSRLKTGSRVIIIDISSLFIIFSFDHKGVILLLCNFTHDTCMGLVGIEVYLVWHVWDLVGIVVYLIDKSGLSS